MDDQSYSVFIFYFFIATFYINFSGLFHELLMFSLFLELYVISHIKLFLLLCWWIVVIMVNSCNDRIGIKVIREFIFGILGISIIIGRVVIGMVRFILGMINYFGAVLPYERDSDG